VPLGYARGTLLVRQRVVGAPKVRKPRASAESASRVVDEIRLNWNTLLPYIEEVARVAQERVQTQETAHAEAIGSPELVAKR